MSKGTSVIQMTTSSVAAAAASIDMQDDGFIEKVYAEIQVSSIGADGEGGEAELSFGSSAQHDTNDARMVICDIRHTLTWGTSVGFGNASARQAFDFGEGLPFFGGERIYIHTRNGASGLMTYVKFLLVCNFKGGPISRRR